MPSCASYTDHAGGAIYFYAARGSRVNSPSFSKGALARGKGMRAKFNVSANTRLVFHRPRCFVLAAQTPSEAFKANPKPAVISSVQMQGNVLLPPVLNSPHGCATALRARERERETRAHPLEWGAALKHVADWRRKRTAPVVRSRTVNLCRGLLTFFVVARFESGDWLLSSIGSVPNSVLWQNRAARISLRRAPPSSEKVKTATNKFQLSIDTYTL
eukprot:6195413-Pleurochrysis_carterae.AAC.5